MLCTYVRALDTDIMYMHILVSIVWPGPLDPCNFLLPTIIKLGVVARLASAGSLTQAIIKGFYCDLLTIVD